LPPTTWDLAIKYTDGGYTPKRAWQNGNAHVAHHWQRRHEDDQQLKLWLYFSSR